MTAPLHAQPTITSFTPWNGPIGTVVTITGTNFSTTAANNIVFFGATMAAVTGASTTELTVIVPSGATYQPVSVTVDGSTRYSSQPFLVTFTTVASITSGSLAAKVDFTTQTTPFGVALGDIDGDGQADLVVTNFNSGSVSVFRNTSVPGSITFDTRLSFATGTKPPIVAIGDMDCDGKLDLVVTNNGSNSVSVFRNTSASGSITFATRVDFTTGTNPPKVAIGDIDGDGKPDLSVVNYNSSTISVFRNTSSPGLVTFASKVDFTPGSFPEGVAIADMDGDGKPDLIVANAGSATVSVFRNTSSPGSIASDSFAPSVDSTTGAYPVDVATGDIDGDGKLDLVVTNNSSNTVSVIRNTSSPGLISFNAKVDFMTGWNPYIVAIGDMDGDGKPDLAVANFSGNSVSVLRNTSSPGSVTSGSFNATVDFTTGTGPYGVAIGDLDGDGRPDLATANELGNSVSVLLNNIGPLAVELMSFIATSNRFDSDLTWETATETNNFGFEIQRRQFPSEFINADTCSFAGNAGWAKVGFVRGAGTTTASHAYSFHDRSLRCGWYSYRLKQIDASGNSTFSLAADVKVGVAPEVFSLSQNYPNPFNPTTTIEFSLQEDGLATLKLYDALGREVATLLDGERKAGYYRSATIGASRLGSGMYIYRLEANGKLLSRKMLLVK
ncbi:MAG: FG-GAP-like repeat-containing protein [Bacteroidota bacterium]